MFKKIIAYLKAKKENRRKKKAGKFMYDQAFCSYDYFIGLDDNEK